MNLDAVTADVIGDVALVLGAAWLLGAVARRIGQPTVVGQIVAGILLGPSLLGRFPGHLTGRLFTHEAVPFISVISQLAVVIFMFSVGYEIDFRSMRRNGRSASLIATGALLVPLALGSGVAMGARHAFSAIGEQHAGGRSFVLFIGVAISITALPVLAAIVRERGIAGTTVGVVATAAAGFMDVSAWLVLAFALIGTEAAGARPWPETVLFIAGFVAVMIFVVRPALKWWIRRPGALVSSQAPAALVLAAAGAWVTASLGLHPIFGAFIAGLVMPGREEAPDADVLRSMEIAGGLLLPLFFVVTGLTTNISALNGGDVALLVVIVACAMFGKIGPGYVMARLGGLDARQSATVAVLVNTRGLTELIALNVGLNAGIITDRLFTILVLMALVTTIMTGPLISAIGRIDKRPSVPQESGSLTEPGVLD
ncbi:cation:proton antiporter [Actinoallomurus acaciae]|uniref:Cation:proton antiporter n=1 Tax=Actinoallomurus acaciae TaxID=502577 RepID=A0ABV5YNC3_9ACTN